MQFTDALLMFLPMLAGPSIAGITMTGIVDGKSGFQDLFSRMGKWRVGVRWYAAAILIPPVLLITVLLALTILISPVFSPIFFPGGILIGLLAGFFEEIGWMGYAFPKMELKHSALATGIYLGLLHTAWHVVADYLGT
jgi:membrane protease YdiL (CAAX protease family)